MKASRSQMVLGSCIAAILTSCGGSQSVFGVAGNDTVTIRKPSTSCLTSTCIYVAVTGSTGLSRIAIFPSSATGNVSPYASIIGKNTMLELAESGVAVGLDHQVYASSNANNFVTNYSVGSYGNKKPKVLVGSSTGLDGPESLAVDSKGNKYVANLHAPSVTVYHPQEYENGAPIQTISGSNTGLLSPCGIAVDPKKNIYVANCYNVPSRNSIEVYAAKANGNVAPIESISGSNTMLLNVTAIALDATGDMYITNLGSQPSIEVYAAGAVGNVAPIATIMGSNTRLSVPMGIAVDAAGNIYVANRYPGSVTVYPAGSNGNVAPSQVIKGSNTRLDGTGVYAWAIAVQ